MIGPLALLAALAVDGATEADPSRRRARTREVANRLQPDRAPEEPASPYVRRMTWVASQHGSVVAWVVHCTLLHRTPAVTLVAADRAALCRAFGLDLPDFIRVEGPAWLQDPERARWLPWLASQFAQVLAGPLRRTSTPPRPAPPPQPHLRHLDVGCVHVRMQLDPLTVLAGGDLMAATSLQALIRNAQGAAATLGDWVQTALLVEPVRARVRWPDLFDYLVARGVPPGDVDAPGSALAGALAATLRWHDELADEARESPQLAPRDLHYRWPDGWALHRLTTPEQLREETAMMGHCIGEGAYARRLARPELFAYYSLHDPGGQPRLTVEVVISHGKNTIVQARCRANHPPSGRVLRPALRALLRLDPSAERWLEEVVEKRGAALDLEWLLTSCEERPTGPGRRAIVTMLEDWATAEISPLLRRAALSHVVLKPSSSSVEVAYDVRLPLRADEGRDGPRIADRPFWALQICLRWSPTELREVIRDWGRRLRTRPHVDEATRPGEATGANPGIRHNFAVPGGLSGLGAATARQVAALQGLERSVGASGLRVWPLEAGRVTLTASSDLSSEELLDRAEALVIEVAATMQVAAEEAHP